MMEWIFWALASAVFAAATAIFAKLGVSDIGSDMATFLRVLVILPVLALVLTVTHGWQRVDGIPPRAMVFLGLSGLATGASWLCYFRALKLGDAARVAPLDKLSVVFVAVLGTLLLGEKLSGINWAGVALIAFGALLVGWR
ncbi:MAG: EamA family transporter [Paracoccus sp. (in: a-proteobacteria)]|uniref:EamA family transporter n=1 Tax=Paracoccus sp. TaxID=267 RepID=UPI0026DF00E0|nr:EamA family transporter [Paracoccus sp. (in: a-proteobacteria)]MDO5622451.1 EamA family transporter [Paracoccus sp. (in: a-proteobacteria)]